MLQRESSAGSRPHDGPFCLLIKSPHERAAHLTRSTFNDLSTHCCVGGASHLFDSSAHRGVLSPAILNSLITAGVTATRVDKLTAQPANKLTTSKSPLPTSNGPLTAHCAVLTIARMAAVMVALPPLRPCDYSNHFSQFELCADRQRLECLPLAWLGLEFSIRTSKCVLPLPLPLPFPKHTKSIHGCSLRLSWLTLNRH